MLRSWLFLLTTMELSREVETEASLDPPPLAPFPLLLVLVFLKTTPSWLWWLEAVGDSSELLVAEEEDTVDWLEEGR